MAKKPEKLKEVKVEHCVKGKKMACGGAAKSRKGFPMTKPVPKKK